jgi:CheY-like chemotaxis protein
MESPDELILAADQALYQAKEAGRDKLGMAAPADGAKAAREKAVSVPRKRPVDVPPSSPGVSLFLLDADDRARADLCRSLGANGHLVWDTGDAREAVRRFAAATPAEHPDVVIVDLDMPDLSGRDVIEVISTISPGVRVVYLADGPNAATQSSNGPGRVLATLRKPVNLEQLLETLDSAGGR